MKRTTHQLGDDNSAVSGQADAVLQNLFRTRSLPTGLSLSIEEILECAWEIAYRRRSGPMTESIIVLPLTPRVIRARNRRRA